MLYNEQYWTVARHDRLQRIFETAADAEQSTWEDVLYAVNGSAPHSRLRMYESEIRDAIAASAFMLNKDGFVTRATQKDPIEKTHETPKRMRDEIDIASNGKRVKLGLDIIHEQPNAPTSPQLVVDVHERHAMRAR